MCPSRRTCTATVVNLPVARIVRPVTICIYISVLLSVCPCSLYVIDLIFLCMIDVLDNHGLCLQAYAACPMPPVQSFKSLNL